MYTKNFSKITALFIAFFSILVALFLPILNSNQILALVTPPPPSGNPCSVASSCASWFNLNPPELTYKNNNFTDNQYSSGDTSLTLSGPVCNDTTNNQTDTSTIQISDSSLNTAQYTFYTSQQSHTGVGGSLKYTYTCVSSTTTIFLNSSYDSFSTSAYSGYWSSTSQIVYQGQGPGTGSLELDASGKGVTFSYTGSTAPTGKTMKLVDNSGDNGAGNSNCNQSSITVNPYSTGTKATLYANTYDSTTPCQSFAPQTIYLTNSYTICSSNSTGCVPYGTGSSSAQPTSSSASIQCPISAPGISWFICPVWDVANAALSALNSQLINYLYVPTAGIFTCSSSTNSSCQGVQSAFNNFRDLGLALLVIAGLVMVVSQSAGFEVFSAYTVRKALPRIVIAIIGIALAWPILQFVITFFDDIGTFTSQILLGVTGTGGQSAFTNPGPDNPFASAASVATGTVGAGLAAGAIGVGVIALGGLGLFSLVLTALLALFVGFIILSIRWLVIVICILTAPLAIAAYVLPGTTKIWHLWRQSLLGALIMFPVIEAFIAAGQAASVIAGGTNHSTVALIVYFAPWFMLPFAFRLTTGIMGTVSSGIQNASGGVFGGLKKQRQGAIATNFRKTMAGERYQGNNGFTAMFNRRGGAAGAFMSSEDKLGFLRSKDSRDTAIARHRAMTSGEYAREAGTAATQFNDDMLHAQTYLGTEDARTNLGKDRGWYEKDENGVDKTDSQGHKIIDNSRVDRAIAAAQAQGGFGVTRQAYATQQLAATGTGYEDMEDMTRVVARVSGNNKSMASGLIGNMRSSSERAGRSDLKGDFNTMNGLASDVMDGKTDGIHERFNEATAEAARAVDNPTLLRQKPKAVAKMTNALTESMVRYERIAASTGGEAGKEAQEKAGAYRAKLENMQSASSFGYGPEGNVQQFHKQVAENPDAQLADGNPASQETKSYKEQKQNRNYDPRDPGAPQPPEPPANNE